MQTQPQQSNDYQFTNDWFQVTAKENWDFIFSQFMPSRILEIGSFEGASACYLIDKLTPYTELEVHCVDTWLGSIEHQPGSEGEEDMLEVEKRYRHNVELAVERAENRVELYIHKGESATILPRLLMEKQRNYFDFIYIDGSHQASDVLCDAVLSFLLLKNGGLMGFDDYLFAETLPQGLDLLRCPKPAIDAFVNTYLRKIRLFQSSQSQLYILKISD
ncbi:MAG: class I SAM-dependent methyltransferase [Enterobacteriaceae bacterium]